MMVAVVVVVVEVVVVAAEVAEFDIDNNMIEEVVVEE